ncbi:MAG: hypothetical protein H0W21_01325, partial [Actinobacteria bacterium]|nr:hypothetical protein [Actinomycetota bacterium]
MSPARCAENGMTLARTDHYACKAQMREADMESADEIIRRTDVLDKLSEIVFETDPVGNWTYLNRAWTTITGFGVKET